MAHDGPTLPDMLARLPHLLASCLPVCRTKRAEIIKALRLVSKDMGCTVILAVTSCEVQLGVGACPTPQQLVGLMGGTIKLESLNVTILTTSALDGLLLDEQLALCTSQAEQLVLGMEMGMQSITTLTVTAKHTPHRSSRSSISQPLVPTQEYMPVTSCPAPFADISRTVCSILAPVLPSLQTLSVEGCCRNADLGSFGFNCPKLAHLQVEPISVPIKTLKNIHLHLPSLRSFGLKSSLMISSQLGQQVAAYVGDCLRVLAPCASLTHMDIALSEGPEMSCTMAGNGNWSVVPQSLREFLSMSQVRNLHEAVGLLEILHTLSVIRMPEFHDMTRVLSRAPNLRRFSVTGPTPVFVNCHTSWAQSDAAALAECCFAGLHLEIKRISLRGTFSSVPMVMQELPILPSVQHCEIMYGGKLATSQTVSYAHVSHVFPNITKLGLHSHLEIPGMGVELLSPLTACVFLEDLTISIIMPHTTSGLAPLCLSMPALKRFGYAKDPTVDVQQLEDELRERGRSVQLRELLM